MSDISSGIACYYGDNDFITQNFDFIVYTKRAWLDTDSRVT